MKHQAAFTLLELLFCLIILAIVSCMSVNTYMTWVGKIRVKTAVQDIAMAARYARTRAYLDAVTYRLEGLPGKGDWSEGMSLRNAQGKEVFRWRWRHIQVDWHGFQGKSSLLFAADPIHAASNGYFTVRAAGFSETLVLNRLGGTHVKA